MIILEEKIQLEQDNGGLQEACRILWYDLTLTVEQLQNLLDTSEVLVTPRAQRIKNWVRVPPLDENWIPILSNIQ